MTKIVKQEKQNAQLAPWEQEALNEAKADAAKFSQGTPRISFKGGVISADGNKLGQSMTVAIIDAVFGKAYYEGAYNPKVQQTPVCYGFSAESAAQIVPHEACPEKQHEACAGCPHNKFGTAERGNGKRCKDEIRLMLVAPSDDDMGGAEVRMATIPPGSLKAWSGYINRLRDMNASFRTVLTKIDVEPGEEGGFKLTFSPAAKLTEAQFMALKARRESAREQAMQPYPVLEAAEEPAPKKNRSKKLD